MIKIEIEEVRGTEFKKTYSTTGYMIERDGIRYGVAYDPIDTDRTYTESDERIPEDGLIEDDYAI